MGWAVSYTYIQNDESPPWHCQALHKDLANVVSLTGTNAAHVPSTRHRNHSPTQRTSCYLSQRLTFTVEDGAAFCRVSRRSRIPMWVLPIRMTLGCPQVFAARVRSGRLLVCSRQREKRSWREPSFGFRRALCCLLRTSLVPYSLLYCCEFCARGCAFGCSGAIVAATCVYRDKRLGCYSTLAGGIVRWW